MDDYKFEECQSCASISGTPTLCDSCLNNRFAIESMSRHIKQYRNTVDRLVIRIDNLESHNEFKKQKKRKSFAGPRSSTSQVG